MSETKFGDSSGLPTDRIRSVLRTEGVAQEEIDAMDDSAANMVLQSIHRREKNLRKMKEELPSLVRDGHLTVAQAQSLSVEEFARVSSDLFAQDQRYRQVHRRPSGCREVRSQRDEQDAFHA